LNYEQKINMNTEHYKCGCGKWDLDSVICEKHQTMFRVADKISIMGEHLWTDYHKDLNSEENV